MYRIYFHLGIQFRSHPHEHWRLGGCIARIGAGKNIHRENFDDRPVHGDTRHAFFLVNDPCVISVFWSGYYPSGHGGVQRYWRLGRDLFGGLPSDVHLWFLIFLWNVYQSGFDKKADREFYDDPVFQKIQASGHQVWK